MTLAADRSGSPSIPVPEPGLTAAELIQRASAMRPLLREQQQATEERGIPSPEAHAQLMDSGLYRMLQPRRFGGYETSLADTLKAAIEVSRGCPATGWHFVFMAVHNLLLAELFDEQAQSGSYAPDGVFLAPGRVPMGTAFPVDGGWLVNGTWDYCSGAPYATHFLPSVMLPAEGDPAGPPVTAGLAVVPRDSWTMLDDWGDVLGLRGTGSNSIVIENLVLPEHAVVRQNVMSVDVSTPTPGYELHGNPLYAGRLLSMLVAELGAWSVGVAWAMLDAYEEMMRTRTTMFPPKILRFEHHDYQRHYGVALGMVESAEAIVIRTAQLHLEFSERGLAGGEPFSAEEDARLWARHQHAFAMACGAVDLLFRTGGTTAAMNGAPSQRYFRDISMARTHIGQQIDASAEQTARVRFGLPSIHG